ncbi:hypothetical protein J6590_077524 [Homalodisca vitripennis]|nr:hypothetical protein J6590_077524 [Homalodisca vitripennis]
MCSVCEGLGLNSGHPENKIACGFRAERVVYAPGFWRPYRLSLFCLQSMCVYSPVGFSDTSSEDSVFLQRREFFEIMCFYGYNCGYVSSLDVAVLDAMTSFAIAVTTLFLHMILHQRSTTDHCREALIENSLRLSSRASSR